jgi:hypothetical protein
MPENPKTRQMSKRLACLIPWLKENKTEIKPENKNTAT